MIDRLALCLVMILFATPVSLAQDASSTASGYQVDAVSLDVTFTAIRPTEYPEVGHLAEVPYEQAARNWAEQHFQLTGNTVNRLRVSVTDAGIVETLLPIKRGFKGWFKKEESVRYDAVLAMDIAIVDVSGNVLASASGRATETRTLVEGATDADKRKAWDEMISSTFAALDGSLAGPMRQNLGAYVR